MPEFLSVGNYVQKNIYNIGHRTAHLGVGREGLHPLPVEPEPSSDGPHHVGVVAVRVLRHEEREAVDDEDEGRDDVEVPRLRPDLVDLEVLVFDVDVVVVAAAGLRDRPSFLSWKKRTS